MACSLARRIACFVVLSCLTIARANALSGRDYSKSSPAFSEPSKFHSNNGLLDVTMDMSTVTFNGATQAFSASVFGVGSGGQYEISLPGPTMYINPGDKLRINFSNKLTSPTGTAKWKTIRTICIVLGVFFFVGAITFYAVLYWIARRRGYTPLKAFYCQICPSCVLILGLVGIIAAIIQSGHNTLHAADVANLHFHGAYASSKAPGDDSSLLVNAGSSYQYEVNFPADHMPGTLWIHPHHHGSTMFHVGSGAASALIIKDPPGYLPAQLANAKDRVFLAQQLDMKKISEAASTMGLDSFQNSAGASSDSDSSWLVNGLYQPVIDMQVNEWQRWRVIHAGYLKGSLGVGVPSCEVKLLAKDSIYIQDFPRTITSTSIPAGGRADIMVRCTTAGDHVISGTGGIVRVTASTLPSVALSPWAPTPLPNYLADLRTASVPGECTCKTKLGAGGTVNHRKFDPNFFTHEAKLGTTAEREIDNGKHPYHQHVYPFQIQSGGDGGFLKVGDWHDTMSGSFTMRFHPTVFEGKMVVHCHILEHEDNGMMGAENIGNTCVCGARGLGIFRWCIIGGVCLCLWCCCTCGACIFLRRRAGKQGVAAVIIVTERSAPIGNEQGP